MIRVIIIVMFSGAMLFSQDQSAFLKFESEKKWIIQIEDSLMITTGKVYTLPQGSYGFKARQEMSYYWPSIFVEDTITISAGDTLRYVLPEQNSGAEELNIMPSGIHNKPVIYSKAAFSTRADKNTSVKTTLIVSALAANWFSFYLKRKADNYYDKYRSASNLSRINYYYDKTEQFDNFSEIMLGISTVALGTYIYLLLNE